MKFSGRQQQAFPMIWRSKQTEKGSASPNPCGGRWANRQAAWYLGFASYSILSGATSIASSQLSNWQTLCFTERRHCHHTSYAGGMKHRATLICNFIHLPEGCWIHPSEGIGYISRTAGVEFAGELCDLIKELKLTHAEGKARWCSSACRAWSHSYFCPCNIHGLKPLRWRNFGLQFAVLSTLQETMLSLARGPSLAGHPPPIDGKPSNTFLRVVCPWRLTIVEAMSILGSFDAALRDYALKKLRDAGVRIIEKVKRSWRLILKNSLEWTPPGISHCTYIQSACPWLLAIDSIPARSIL